VKRSGNRPQTHDRLKFYPHVQESDGALTAKVRILRFSRQRALPPRGIARRCIRRRVRVFAVLFRMLA
jgi:hypothetical protein